MKLNSTQQKIVSVRAIYMFFSLTSFGCPDLLDMDELGLEPPLPAGFWNSLPTMPCSLRALSISDSRIS